MTNETLTSRQAAARKWRGGEIGELLTRPFPAVSGESKNKKEKS